MLLRSLNSLVRGLRSIRYAYMLVRNAATYRAICLRAGNDCLTTAPRVENNAGYLYVHYVIANRLTKLPVPDPEGTEYVGWLDTDKLPKRT